MQKKYGSQMTVFWSKLSKFDHYASEEVTDIEVWTEHFFWYLSDILLQKQLLQHICETCGQMLPKERNIPGSSRD